MSKCQHIKEILFQLVATYGELLWAFPQTSCPQGCVEQTKALNGPDLRNDITKTQDKHKESPHLSAFFFLFSSI